MTTNTYRFWHGADKVERSSHSYQLQGEMVVSNPDPTQ